MRVIIFDMDGTVADSFDYVADFLAGERGWGPLSMAQKRGLRSMSMVGMAKKLGFHWWDGPRLFIKGRRRMKEAIRDWRAFEGMPKLIRKLHAGGYPLYVLSTNSQRNIQHFLEDQKIRQYFSDVYAGVGVFGKAPALRQLLSDHKLAAEQTVYIGDELRDVKAAQAIGMPVVAVSWGFANRRLLEAAHPTALVDTPAELLRVLEDL